MTYGGQYAMVGRIRFLQSIGRVGKAKYGQAHESKLGNEDQEAEFD